jgi:CBS domain-containing protein
MAQLTAKEIMVTNVLTVGPEAPVKDIAKLFSEKRIGGAPVVDDKKNVIGIVTDGDLIMQDVKIHFPHYISLLDGFIILGSTRKFEQQLRKAVGAKVEDVMTKDVVTIGPDILIEDVATLMVERNISRLPVVEGGKLIGLVSRGDIVKSLSRS